MVLNMNQSIQTPIINRVVIYVRNDNDDWGNSSVIAIADIQVRFPTGSLSAIKGFQVVKTANSYGVIIPTTKIGLVTIPLIRGKELLIILESAILKTVSKIFANPSTNDHKGEIWEQSRANDVYYFGLAKGEYSNAQYRTYK